MGSGDLVEGGVRGRRVEVIKRRRRGGIEGRNVLEGVRIKWK